MRRRSERQKDIDDLKQTLYSAGVSTLQAAQAQEEMLTTALEALTDAYEAQATPQAMPQLGAATDSGPDLQPILNSLWAGRQQALTQGDYDAYVAAETKLQHLDELRVARIEREVRELTARQRLNQLTESASTEAGANTWTEANLKAQYGTLGAVKEAFSIKPRSWKEAVQMLNQR